MEFEQHVQITLEAGKGIGNGRIIQLTHAHFTPKDMKVARVHVICKCISYTVFPDRVNFRIKPRSYSRKIVVITYTDDTQQFLEFNIVPHDVK